MKYLKYNEFVNESLLFSDDDIINNDVKKQVNAPNYLIHVSNPSDRNSILRHGLIPNSDNQWKKLADEMGISHLYNKAIFAVTFKNSIDVYDIKDISNYIFPLPLTLELLPQRYRNEIDDIKYEIREEIHKLKQSSKFKNNKKFIQKELINSVLSGFDYKISKIVQKHSNVDIWLIENHNKWYKDNFGNTDSIDGNSVYTESKISSKYLTLIKRDGIINLDDIDDI